MNEDIKRLQDCLKTMKKCIKIPHVENCVCFSDAFKVLDSETDRLQKIALAPEDKEKLITVKDEIRRIRENISLRDKECIGCDPCMASVVFNAYPEALNNLYTNNEL